MAFSITEKTNIAYHLSLGLTNLAPVPAGAQQWYNINTSWKMSIDPKMIWIDFNNIPPASTPIEADNNVITLPTLIEKTKVKLTLLNTTNNRGYLARKTYNDHSSELYENWLLPAYIQNGTGVSAGYTIRLFNGDPDNGGTEISTSYLADSEGTTSWAFFYSNGLLQISTDTSSTYKNMYDTNGLYIVGYRYIGRNVLDITTGSTNGYAEIKDRITITDENILDYKLTNIPIHDSEKVFVQGIFRDSQNGDYSIFNDIITFSSDIIENGKKIVIIYNIENKTDYLPQYLSYDL